MGSREDEKRLREFGQATSFPHIPKSLQPAFGGAGAIHKRLGQIVQETEGSPGDQQHYLLMVC